MNGQDSIDNLENFLVAINVIEIEHTSIGHIECPCSIEIIVEQKPGFSCPAKTNIFNILFKTTGSNLLSQ